MDDGWRDFEDAVEAFDWAAYAVPKYPLDPPYHRVPDALRRLLAARDEADAHAAYGFVLDAVGHNHSGTLFSVLVPALPFLIRIALHAGAWSQFAALEVMVDAISWLSWGEPRHPFAPDPASALRSFDAHRAALRALAEDPTKAAEVRASARELLAALSGADCKASANAAGS